MSSPTSRFYEFGPFRLDAVRRLLMRDGAPVPLTPKAFDTLLALVENCDRPLEKAELMEMLWPDSVVEERNLTVNISALRKVLGESASDHRYIVTIPGQGYRFVSSVRHLQGEAASFIVERHSRSRISIQQRGTGEPREAGTNVTHSLLRARGWGFGTSRRNNLAMVLLLTAATVVGGYLWISHKSSNAKPALSLRSIAVLPFISEDRIDEYLGLTVTDTLIRRLSQIKQITVRSTNSLQKQLGVEQDAATVARRLGAVSALDGYLRRSGENVSVKVRLIDVQSGGLLWEEIFDGKLANIFLMHDAITEHLSIALGWALTNQEKVLLTRRYTESVEAYEAYLKGAFFWNDRTSEGLHQSFLFFEQAIEKDPNFALGYAGLANAYAFDARRWPKAEEMAKRALELDETLAEPHATLGFIKMFWQWNWQDAEKEFTQAIAISPECATAHHWYALYFAVLGGNFGGKSIASAEMELALKLDPLSPVINADMGQVLYFARRYEEAIAACQKAIEIDPGFLNAHLYLYDIYTQKGAHQEAADKFFELVRLPGGAGYADSATLQALRKAYETEGIRGFWKERIKALSNPREHPPNAYAIAQYYSRLGEKEQALYWLEEAYQSHLLYLTYVKVDPVFEGLWHDLRFVGLLRRMKMLS